jgi:hypothetical protein
MTASSDAVVVVHRVRRALTEMGPRPDVHRAQLARLRTDWPSLYAAVMSSLTDREKARLTDRSTP